MTSLAEKKSRVLSYLANCSTVAKMLCKYSWLYDGEGLARLME
jgi:hypothetical protein